MQELDPKPDKKPEETPFEEADVPQATAATEARVAYGDGDNAAQEHQTQDAVDADDNSAVDIDVTEEPSVPLADAQAGDPGNAVLPLSPIMQTMLIICVCVWLVSC
jgi:hypothetical protein